jgi:hypothetical protein
MQGQTQLSLFDVAHKLTGTLSYPFDNLFGTIFLLSYPRRKLLLKACRIQGPFSTSSRFYTRYRQELLEYIDYPQLLRNSKRWRANPTTFDTLWDVIQRYHLLFSSPILAGFVSMILRYAPYDDTSSIRQAEREAIDKEIAASQSPKPAVGLNYSRLFSSQPSTYANPPYHEDVPDNHTLEKTIGCSIIGSITALQHSSRLLLPSTTRKRFPPVPHSLEPFARFNNHAPIETILDAERVYANSGIQLEGPTSIGVVVMGNTGGPRAFYRRGLTKHSRSRYVQPILNAMVDSLSTTNRRTRFNLFNLDFLTPEMISMIYDYASFTSKLQEIRKFTNTLGNHLGLSWVG